MPGSGKSYFGKKLAAATEMILIDLDKVIEEQEACTISEIFNNKGEDCFREIEAAMLRKVSQECTQGIISTGGGTPCFHEGIDYMNKTGITVFLETEKSLLIERLDRKDHRPLMQGDTEKRVDQLLESRLSIYKKAHISIAHRDVDLLLNQINSIKN